MVQQLTDAIQENLVPSLVGCTDTDVSRRDLAEQKQPVIQGAHQRRYLAIGASRFVILNAFVKGKDRPETVCQEGSPFPDSCHDVNQSVAHNNCFDSVNNNAVHGSRLRRFFL